MTRDPFNRRSERPYEALALERTAGKSVTAGKSLTTVGKRGKRGQATLSLIV
jgi:hypothetical protein